MPVTMLFVEGELDEQLLSAVFAGAPVVERRGTKYGLQGMVLRERESTGSLGVHFLRDRDFDFEPTTGEAHSPTPIVTQRNNVVVGWRWFRHSIEGYLLEPSLVATALERQQGEVEALVRECGRELVSYQAARWTVGQARSKLPPSRHLETSPPDLSGDFDLPTDRSEAASWNWLSAATREFIAPVADAFAESTLRQSFDDYRTKFAAFEANDMLVWFSGKNILSLLAPKLGFDSPKLLQNRLRNWIRANPDEAVRLLPEWAALKRFVSQ